MTTFKMFLNGTAMSGGADHHAVRDSKYLGPARTADNYRFIAVRDEFPGLLPADGNGTSIEGELWVLTTETWEKHLSPAEPPELEISTISLDDGTEVRSMILQLDRVDEQDLLDISSFGGWRNYLASIGRETA